MVFKYYTEQLFKSQNLNKCKIKEKNVVDRAQ